MTIMRALLLLFMGFLVLLMFGVATASHPQKRTKLAFFEYWKARQADEAGSTLETQRNLEAARFKLEEAKRLDLKKHVITESVLLAVLGLAMYGFVRAGRGIVDCKQSDSAS